MRLWLSAIVVRRLVLLVVVLVLLVVVVLDILGVSPMAMERALPVLRLLFSVVSVLGNGLGPIDPMGTGDF